MEHTWRQWEPNIIYVHHQSAPFPTRIWLPPFAEPIATHAPYLMSREVNMIGMAIAQRLEEEGQGRRDAHGHRLRRVVSRLHRLHAGVQEHPGVLDRDAGQRRRRRARPIPPRSRRTCAGRRRCTPARGWAARGGCAMRSSTCRPRRWRRSTTRASTRTRCSTTGITPAGIRSREAAPKRRTRTSFRRTSAIRSPPSRCCAASRSAASACRS